MLNFVKNLVSRFRKKNFKKKIFSKPVGGGLTRSRFTNSEYPIMYRRIWNDVYRGREKLNQTIYKSVYYLREFMCYGHDLARV